MSWDDTLRRMLPPIGGVPPHITGPAGMFGAGEAEGRGPRSSRPHKGVDANYFGGQNALNKSRPILHAPVDGEVILSGGRSGTISIRDRNGFVHKLMHTATRNVGVGDRVIAGDSIGTMGNTDTHDYHLHYQLEDSKGRQVDPVDFWERQASPAPNVPAPVSGEAPIPAPATSSSGSANQNPIADRSGKWGSVPLPSKPAGSEDSAGFNDRYGNWATSPAGVLGNVGAPAPQPVPDQGKRSEQDDTPVRVLSRVSLSPAPVSVDAPSLSPASALPLFGIFSGKPMPDYRVWPSIFDTDNRSSPDDVELYQRWRRFLDA